MVAGVLYEVIGPTWTIVIGAIPIFIVWIIYQFVSHKHRYTYSLIPIDVPRKPRRITHKT